MGIAVHLKIMTFNIWNYNRPWKKRRKLIAKLVTSEMPDIIGFQEIRNDVLLNEEGRNQIEQLAEDIGSDYAFVYQPAMVYSVYPRKEEGLAVMSRYPILESNCTFLSRDPTDVKDYEQRIVLQAKIELPIGHLNFFNTHLSRSHAARLRTILEIYRYVSSFESELPKVLVGDFNATPDSEPIKFLVGKLEMKGLKGNFQDAWAVANPNLPGFTSRSDLPNKRIDYIFITPRGSKYLGKVLSVSTIGESIEGIFPSDHLGVVATVRFDRL